MAAEDWAPVNPVRPNFRVDGTVRSAWHGLAEHLGIDASEARRMATREPARLAAMIEQRKALLNTRRELVREQARAATAARLASSTACCPNSSSGHTHHDPPAAGPSSPAAGVRRRTHGQDALASILRKRTPPRLP